jgi:uncharacterized membrane protein YqjE
VQNLFFEQFIFRSVRLFIHLTLISARLLAFISQWFLFQMHPLSVSLVLLCVLCAVTSTWSMALSPDQKERFTNALEVCNPHPLITPLNE